VASDSRRYSKDFTFGGLVAFPQVHQDDDDEVYNSRHNPEEAERSNKLEFVSIYPSSTVCEDSPDPTSHHQP
jgi:hypothetical protein